MFEMGDDYFNPMHEIIQPSGGKGGLFLGGIEAASDFELLKAHNI